MAKKYKGFKGSGMRVIRVKRVQKKEAFDDIMKPFLRPIIHGLMTYQCEQCGNAWDMYLEIGVEDFGRNGRPHQPSPFYIRCSCGGAAHDISGYMPASGELNAPTRYFAYDNSGKEYACGIPKVFDGYRSHAWRG